MRKHLQELQSLHVTKRFIVSGSSFRILIGHNEESIEAEGWRRRGPPKAY
jgi:hypothetical protein